MDESSSPLLTGQLLSLLIIASVLALFISWWLLSRYKKAVISSMKKRTSGAKTEQSTHSNNSFISATPSIVYYNQQATNRLNSEIQFKSVKRAQLIYLSAIALSAICTSIVFLESSGTELIPLRVLVLSVVYVWPVVMVNLLFLQVDSSRKTRTIALYAAIFLAIGSIAQIKSGFFRPIELIVLWGTSNLLPTLILMIFFIRRIRAVGPLVFVFLFIAFSGAQIVLSFFRASDARLESVVDIGLRFGVSGSAMFIVLIVLGLLLFSLPGWLILKRISTLYRQKRISDQMISIDTLMITYIMSYSLLIGSHGVRWLLLNLLTFVVFKVTCYILFKKWKQEKTVNESTERLLFLRVFSLGKRSQQFYDAFGEVWRYHGSIQMIAGPDLATSAVEPHEFLDYIAGKLSRRFIDGTTSYENRFRECDFKADADHRFRVNEFFCHDDTWTYVLKQLVLTNEYIIMDLRGFNKNRQGCIYEIETLINFVSTEKVLFLVDSTTDEKLLNDYFTVFWSRLTTDAPNYNSHSSIQMFKFNKPAKEVMVEMIQALTRRAVAIG